MWLVTTKMLDNLVLILIPSKLSNVVLNLWYEIHRFSPSFFHVLILFCSGEILVTITILFS